MRLIEIKALDNGAHNNQTINGVILVPYGWAVIPDDMTIPDTFPFVDIEVDGQTVVSMMAGTVPEPEPEQTTEPSEEDDTVAMLVDHEYRLTLLEHGLAE